MAYQALGLGTNANDGTGDTLRIGGDKVNDNFVELYTKFGDGSALSSNVSVGGNAATATILAASRTIAGVAFNGSAAITLASTNLSNTAAICLATNTLTLTNKTLTSPVIGGTATTASGNLVVDPASQILEIKGNGSNLEGMLKLNCHANTHGQTLKAQPHSAGITNISLLPQGTGTSTLVSKVSTDILTNKTLADLKTSVQAITGAGAINLTTGVTEITTDSADAFSLANGTVGQIKIITLKVDAGDATITPSTFAGGSTITMGDAGDSIMLTYATTIGWVILSNNGCAIG